MLLASEFLNELERVQLRGRRRLTGTLGGEHRSPRYGSSIDFADARSYHPGDDYRRIDYNLLARLDQLVVRLYEADDDLTVRLVIDTTASMGIGDKLGQARRVAAALGFVTLIRRDNLSVHTFPVGRSALSPRFIGRHAVGSLFRHLESLRAEGRSDLVSPVMDLLARPGLRGHTILVSDLLAPDWDTALRRLPSRGDDLTVIHILADEDLRPELLGEFDLVDVETGQRVPVSLSAAVVSTHVARMEAWRADVAGRCRYVGANYVELGAQTDLRQAFRRSWRSAGVLR